MNIKYAFKLSPEEGGFLVQSLDFETIFTEGETQEEALYNAVDVLSAMLEEYLEMGQQVPLPKKITTKRGISWVAPNPDIQVAVLTQALKKEVSVSTADIARHLKTGWAAAQRFEKPGNNPTLKKLNELANTLGKQLVVSFE